MTVHQKIYERLKEVASNGDLVTYGEIAPLADLNMENPDDRDKIADILGDISRHENEHGRPMLSAIVVLSGYSYPGEGFFTLARELDRLHGKKEFDELDFFVHEAKKVYECWQK